MPRCETWTPSFRHERSLLKVRGPNLPNRANREAEDGCGIPCPVIELFGRWGCITAQPSENGMNDAPFGTSCVPGKAADSAIHCATSLAGSQNSRNMLRGMLSASIGL